MIKSYSKIKECVSFLSWLYHEFDEPAEIKGDKEGRWFKYLGSPYRRRFRRLFGFEREWCYWRQKNEKNLVLYEM